MNIAILGYGKQGQSAFEYWKQADNNITICDIDPSLTLPKGVHSQLGDDYLKSLDRFDLIVRSPKTHPTEIVRANPDAVGILNKVTTNTNEFMSVCPTKNIIGITGTKGKGTTSSLITAMLESAGYRVHLGGNIGIPPLDMLKQDIQPDDWVVLELANFQLIDLKYSPTIAVALMMADEHLDWHGNMHGYIEAKQQLFRWQGSNDIAVFYAKNALSQQVASASRGKHIPYFEPPGATVENQLITISNESICPVSEIKLPGEHNWQNVCAAVTVVWQITQNIPAIRHAVQHFGGLPFRIEERKTIDGVVFYNDSFSTNPSAAQAAVRAITQPKIMIIGGYERGIDLSSLTDLLTDPENNVKQVVVIGQAGDRVYEILQAKGATNIVKEPSHSMMDIVKTAKHFAGPGDAVVLSPAFASFDMFKNFEERGLAFNEAVEAL